MVYDQLTTQAFSPFCVGIFLSNLMFYGCLDVASLQNSHIVHIVETLICPRCNHKHMLKRLLIIPSPAA